MSPDELRSLFPFESDDEVYILLAIARKKHNPDIQSYSHEVVIREVVRGQDEWERKLNRMLSICSSFRYKFCYYVTFNPRSALKAYKVMKEKFAIWDYQGANKMLARIKKIDRIWISMLQLRDSRARRQYYVVDIDEGDLNLLDRVKYALEAVDAKPKLDRRTVGGGFHVLAPQFNVVLFKETLGNDAHRIEIKKDDLFQIGYDDA